MRTRRFLRPPIRASRLLLVFLAASMVFHASSVPRAQAAGAALAVDTLVDSNDPAYQVCSDGPRDCSLRGAISRSNADPAILYAIDLPAGVYALGLHGPREDDNATGDLDVQGQVWIAGAGVERTIIDGGQLDRVLHVHSRGNVTLIDAQITGGQAVPSSSTTEPGGHGGGIYNEGMLILAHCLVRGNHAGDGFDGLQTAPGTAGGSGGGIYNLGRLTLESTTLSNNAAGMGGAGYQCPDPFFCLTCSMAGDGGSGGGVFSEGQLDLRDSLLTDNATGAAGPPGVCTIWGDVLLQRGTDGAGGGVANDASATFVGAVVSSNEGRIAGGGIRNSGRAVVSDSAITGNLGQWGGGIHNSGTLVVHNSPVRDNRDPTGISHSSGGGIHNSGQLSLFNSPVENNVGGQGGGIGNEGVLTLVDSPIRDNSGALGGGIYNRSEAKLTHSAITGNRTREGAPGSDVSCVRGVICDPPQAGATPSGGGVYNLGTMTIEHSEIHHNVTGRGGRGGNGGSGWTTGAEGGDGGAGGGVYNSSELTLDHCSVIGNGTGEGGPGGMGSSENGAQGEDGTGGGIYSSGPMTMTASAVVSNTTSGRGNGGGIAIEGSVPNLANSVIGQNVAGGAGSGLYVAGTSARLIHTTIAQNRAGGAGTGDGAGIHAVGSTVYLTNTILVSHTMGITVAAGSTVRLEATLWGSGSWANGIDWSGAGTVLSGTLNPRGNPGFVAPHPGDYHIGAASAAVDSGLSIKLRTDMDGQARPHYGGHDLGADEWWPLVVVKTPAHDLVEPGETITYSLILTNSSRAAMTVRLTDTLASQVRYLGPLRCSHGQGRYDSGVVTWSGTVYTDTPVRIAWPVQVRPDVALGNPISNVAVVSDAYGLFKTPPAVLTPVLRSYLPVVGRESR